jgi:hypothetical protein
LHEVEFYTTHREGGLRGGRIVATGMTVKEAVGHRTTGKINKEVDKFQPGSEDRADN